MDYIPDMTYTVDLSVYHKKGIAVRANTQPYTYLMHCRNVISLAIGRYIVRHTARTLS